MLSITEREHIIKAMRKAAPGYYKCTLEKAEQLKLVWQELNSNLDEGFTFNDDFTCIRKDNFKKNNHKKNKK